jgi:LysM repeat protein
MKRFLQKTVDVVTPVVESELSMEDLAKMNIRKTLLEAGLALGVALMLSEQAPAAEKKPETPEEAAFRWTFGEEGFAPKWEYDVKHKGKYPTIGYGSRMDLPEFETAAKACFGDKCEDFMRRAKDPNVGITEPEARQIATHSIMTTYKPRVEKMVKNFGELPADVQGALVSSAYRGAITGSPAAVRLMNAGDYEGAAREYINRQDYRDALKPENKKKFGGIVKRMDREAEAIRSLGKSPAPVPTPTTVPTTPAAASALTPKTKESAPVSVLSSQEYEIKKGDTLSAISKRTGRSVEAISRENKIADPNKISVGQKIRIPQG